MRFLLPVIPAVIWLAILGAHSLLTRLRPGLRWATASVLMLLVLSAGIAQVPLSDVMTTAYSQELYRESVLGAQPYLSKPAIVIGMELSGAYLYYVGETMVIWPDLNPGKFELMRAHASIGGRRWYALLSQFEIAEAMRRAPGNWVPIAKFRDVTLFELTYNP